jgi:hypothetical protein
MSVFGNRNYAQQPVARTPGYGKAAQTSAYVQNINNQNKRQDKQENIQGAVGLANSLREGGMLGDSIPAFKKAYAGGAATDALAASQSGLGQFAMNSAPVANTAGAGAFTLGGAEAASAASLAGTGAGAAGAGGLGAGVGAALSSNPVGWAAMAALAAYSLFG